jgi:hypothetical protein
VGPDPAGQVPLPSGLGIGVIAGAENGDKDGGSWTSPVLGSIIETVGPA